MSLRRCTLIVLLASVAGCQPEAGGPAPGTASAASGADPASGEILLASPPSGWVETGAMQTPQLRMAEYGPRAEADDQLERITFEAQAGQPLPDPIDFVLAVSRDLEARCNGFQDINVSSGLENGYPTSVRLMICPEFKDAPNGQVVMAKAIQGNERFYVITRRLRSLPLPQTGDPLTAQEMAAWTTYLKAIGLCDTRDPDHPCPETVPAPDPPATSGAPA